MNISEYIHELIGFEYISTFIGQAVVDGHKAQICKFHQKLIAFKKKIKYKRVPLILNRMSACIKKKKSQFLHTCAVINNNFIQRIPPPRGVFLFVWFRKTTPPENNTNFVPKIGAVLSLQVLLLKLLKKATPPGGEFLSINLTGFARLV